MTASVPLIVALLRHTDLHPEVDPLSGHVSRDDRSAGAPARVFRHPHLQRGAGHANHATESQYW